MVRIKLSVFSVPEAARINSVSFPRRAPQPKSKNTEKPVVYQPFQLFNQNCHKNPVYFPKLIQSATNVVQSCHAQLKVGVGQVLGNVPENFVVFFKEVKVIFVGFVVEVGLQGGD